MHTIILDNGTTYRLTPHALERRQEREISVKMIAAVIEAPENATVDLGGNQKHFRVMTTETGDVRPIIVVVDETDG